MQETQVQSLDQEDLLEKEMATHSSILAWRIPWTEGPGRLWSVGQAMVCGDMTEQLILLLYNMYNLKLYAKSYVYVYIELFSHVQLFWGPMDCSPPGSSVHGILHARTLEWVAIPFSRGSSWSRDWTWVSCTAGRFFRLSYSMLDHVILFHISWWSLLLEFSLFSFISISICVLSVDLPLVQWNFPCAICWVVLFCFSKKGKSYML